MTPLANTVAELTRIQHGVPPPIAPQVLSGHTRLTGRWRIVPFEAYLPGLDDHVLAAMFDGEGHATVHTGGRTLHAPAAPGVVTLVPRGNDGHWHVTGPGVYTCLLLGHARLQRCADEVAGGRVPDLVDRLRVDDPPLFAMLRLIGDEIEAGHAVFSLYLEQIVELVCLHLLRAHASRAARVESAPSSGLPPWQIKRVIAYMREHLEEDIALQDLADLVKLSRFHFCGAFRRATGDTPYDTLTRLRIEEARRLLASSTQPVSDIALAVGFQTPSAFTARFRKVVGVPPMEYRRHL